MSAGLSQGIRLITRLKHCSGYMRSHDNPENLMTVRAPRRAITAAVSLILASATSAFAIDSSQLPALKMVPLSSVRTGGAEIAAHDPQTQRLFVTNAAAATVTILNARNPSRLATVGTIDVSSLGSPNSVAVRDGIVAIAIEGHAKTDMGHVALYKAATGEFLNAVQVGALPDMLTFTPDGKFLLVANEGEPDGYGEGLKDPEGSVSIVPIRPGVAQIKKLRDADVRTADFTRYIGKEESLRADGIRIYGPGANAAQDFEPEYIGVSPDSRKAYVTLQENNAIAVVDIASAKVTALMPLGTKDLSTPASTIATYEWPSNALPSIGATKAGQVLRLGGFSGLAFEGVTADGKLEFITNTDRGPNAEPTATAQRPFLLPQFTPRLARFTLDPANGRFELREQILLKDYNGRPLTGLPNTAVAGGVPETPYNDEVPIDLHGKTLPLDRLGGDFEGIAVDEDGSFWLPDEYRPAIYHFNPNGRLLERFIPIGSHAAAGLKMPAAGKAGQLGTEALPAAFAQRRQNRGMEAIALRDGKVYAFVQSPIRNPATLANGALNAMRNVRVVEFDPATLATRQFVYIMDNPAAVPSSTDTRADKIGDMAVVPGGGFLALERDDDAVHEDDISFITKKIYAFDLGDATDISSLDTPYIVGGAQKSLDQMTADELASVGVKPIEKKLHVDLAEAGYADVEKIEGLTVLGDGRLAVVNDNDFTVAQITVDYKKGTFTRNYVPEAETLGIITVPGFDASDKDDNIDIKPWPVRGLYEPDAIAAYNSRGQTYLVTANEGDARDWPGFAEEARIKSLTLDGTVFPDAQALQTDENLGRLNVTRTLGDADGDGVYDALYTLGGRSFSIWTANGSLVFDSDADLERVTAAADGEHFNASNDNNNFDDRSDNKGPEPEGLTLGSVRGRQYAFVGLERTGGIAAYDVTNPHSPVFVDYVNNRDFAADVKTPAAKDLGPEGVLFIPAASSPTGKPLLAVSNEISGTVTTYSLESPRR